jgi:ketosteroid isomerase-like protein
MRPRRRTRARMVKDLRRADLNFFGALLDRDVPALEALLAEDFLIVDVVSATVHRRAAFLQAISSGTVSFQEIQTFGYDRRIRLMGADAGVVVGRTVMYFSGSDGSGLTVASRYTHVFRANGRRNWQLVSAQGTSIPSTDADTGDQALNNLTALAGSETAA